MAGRELSRERLQAALDRAAESLLESRRPEGCWEGRLSSSALSTATAVSALSIAAPKEDAGLVSAGVRWLARTQNPDGGWGDTPESPSNLSTSLLVHAALRLARPRDLPFGVEAALRGYLERTAGPSEDAWREAVSSAYAPDRTFAVPILSNLALAGAGSWEKVPPLPFELAALPSCLFRFLRLHVVSYALPALIAVGLAIDHHHSPPSFLKRWFRAAVRGRVLRKLEEIQPSSGGFLEAVPLTSFVTMSLASACGPAHPVAVRGLSFLRSSSRGDGSWPIDANLSVWVTTAAVAALAEAGRKRDASASLPWILSTQHRLRHPFTGAAPGGWAWTHLPGGVPDADDTAGALLALASLGAPGAEVRAGRRWLLDLQNSDGGWPTFCRGWGRLPFDRSAPDLTAHVLRALRAADPEDRDPEVRSALGRGLRYLRAQSRPDGSWIPLWFGRQEAPDQANPVLGTARVLRALERLDPDGEAARRGLRFLLGAQNGDGGWGGGAGTASGIEETALAVSALAGWQGEPEAHDAAERGVFNLVEKLESGAPLKAAPIGLYFARLWYHEEAYPLIWTVEAIGRMLNRAGADPGSRTPHAP